MTHLVVLYGGQIGENGKLSSNTIGRCKKALEVARRRPGSAIFFGVDPQISGLREATHAWFREQGWPEDRIISLLPELSTSNQAETADVAIVLLWRRMLNPKTLWRIFTRPSRYTTLGETEVALAEIVRMRFNGEKVEVTAVTSWYHMPRVAATWMIVGYRGKVRYRASSATTRPAYWMCYEAAAFVKLLVVAAKRRFPRLR